MSTMPTIEDSWELQTGGWSCLRIDETVLDQLLRGSRAVYEEIIAAQDRSVDVQYVPVVDRQGTAGDLGTLRQLVRAECELYDAPVAAGSARAAFWSQIKPVDRRADVARAFDCDGLYEPMILLEPMRVISAGDALRAARKIGAIPARANVSLTTSGSWLVGLR